MTNINYTEANRQAWNQTAPIHKEQNFDTLLESFKEPGYSYLDDTESAILSKIGISGKSVAQLCCNNGRELLSVKNMGAGRCVGFDISDEFIAQAHELVAQSAINCDFIRTDVYDIPAEYDHTFDLIYITIGVLGWMPDLGSFFDVVNRLLKPNGQVFVYEVHPITEIFNDEEDGDPLEVKYSYFKDTPFVDDTGLDYYGQTTYESLPTYWFHHKLSDIFQACLQRGLAIKSFVEYDHDISNCLEDLEAQDTRPPLCFTLILEKTVHVRK